MLLSALQQLFAELLSAVLQVSGAGGGGVVVTSYVRTPQRNTEVGGAPTSLHLIGLAVDLAPVTPGLMRAAALWRSLGLDAVTSGSHVHFELDGPSFPKALYLSLI